MSNDISNPKSGILTLWDKLKNLMSNDISKQKSDILRLRKELNDKTGKITSIFQMFDSTIDLEAVEQYLNQANADFDDVLAVAHSRAAALANGLFCPAARKNGLLSVLLIGSSRSTHTVSWVSMLARCGVTVALFSPFPEEAPKDGTLHCDVWWPTFRQHDIKQHRRPFAIHRNLPHEPQIANACAEVVRQWQPDIVHTIGFFDAGRFYFDTLKAHDIRGRPKWLLQLRGGSDLELNRYKPDVMGLIVQAAREADQIMSDNHCNFEYLRDAGVDQARFSCVGVVAGSGGVDLDEVTGMRVPFADRHDIVWPKAYNTPYALALPVLEGLRQAWPNLPSCKIHLLWLVQPEIEVWLSTLPCDMKRAIIVHGNIDRSEVLRIMGRSRVMLAPSLVDGVPNTVYEAMAAGAVPIVSPLETIKRHMSEGNVLFARNLYPEEIARCLKLAMTDDNIAANIVRANDSYIATCMNVREVSERVSRLYNELAKQ